MSTPVDLNIVMPYGVTVEGDGTSKAKPVTNPAKQIGDNVVLPVGPVRIGASWDGPQAVKVGVYRPGIGTIILGTLPEKTGGATPSDLPLRCQSQQRVDVHGSGLGRTPCRHSRHPGGLPAQLRVAHRAGAVV